MEIEGAALFEQLDWHWNNQLRQRLDGLTDAEYFWEPVPGCWTVRVSAGTTEIDWAWPEPDPPPVTTIAWRLAHIIGPVLGFRANWHFGDRSAGWDTFTAAPSADAALVELDAAFTAWRDGVLSAPDAFFTSQSRGPEGTIDEHFPFAQVVMHINREVLHHGAEVALLRDLYTHGRGSLDAPTG